MANLVNHPGKWLRDDAAASLARFEKDHGVQTINSAGRTVAEQQALIARWNRGGAANRPPYLYQPAPATGPNASRHVTNGGTAIDVGNPALFKRVGEAYGWRFLFAYDTVHFEYDPAYDKHKPSGGSSSGLKFSQTVANQQAWMNKSRGEKLAVDGLAGPAYRAAVKRYQQFLKVTADGIWGAGTQAAHQKYYDSYNKPAPAPSTGGILKKGSRGADVVKLQKTLNAKYPAYSKLSADGIFGAGTEAVVKEFQRRSKLTADGIVGSATRRALGI